MSLPQSIDAVFAKAYEDALKFGCGIFKTSVFGDCLTAKRVRHDEVFRWKLRPLPGYSHAHSRKIRREARKRDGVTVRLTREMFYFDPERP